MHPLKRLLNDAEKTGLVIRGVSLSVRAFEICELKIASAKNQSLPEIMVLSSVLQIFVGRDRRESDLCMLPVTAGTPD
jgi:hypothetical protein